VSLDRLFIFCIRAIGVQFLLFLQSSATSILLNQEPPAPRLGQSRVGTHSLINSLLSGHLARVLRFLLWHGFSTYPCTVLNSFGHSLPASRVYPPSISLVLCLGVRLELLLRCNLVWWEGWDKPAVGTLFPSVGGILFLPLYSLRDACSADI
jgi:hypothetical protein